MTTGKLSVVSVFQDIDFRTSMCELSDGRVEFYNTVPASIVRADPEFVEEFTYYMELAIMEAELEAIALKIAELELFLAVLEHFS